MGVGEKEKRGNGKNRLLNNYNDLYHCYNIEKINLERLEDRKEVIRTKYFSLTSKTDSAGQANGYNDKYVSYLAELEKENIIEDIQKQKNIMNKLKYYLNNIEYSLSQLSGIEYRLFNKVINGENVSKAIEEIVAENMINNIKPAEGTIIWRKYYPNIKKEIKKFYEIREEINGYYKK